MGKYFESYSPVSETETKLLDRYEELDIGNCDICKQCRSECAEQKDHKLLSSPVGAWVVGKNFYDHEKRVLFVGKNALGELTNSFADSRDWLWNKKRPYWAYTISIVEELYGNESIENIAFTNLVKCNNAVKETESGLEYNCEFGDKTTPEMKEHCINELSIILEEIKIIKPTHIIFYTNTDYDWYIQRVFNYPKKADWDHPEKIGSKNMPWTESEIIVEGITRPIKILRVGHPQYKKKWGENGFVTKITQWVKDN